MILQKSAKKTVKCVLNCHDPTQLTGRDRISADDTGQ